MPESIFFLLCKTINFMNGKGLVVLKEQGRTISVPFPEAEIECVADDEHCNSNASKQSHKFRIYGNGRQRFIDGLEGERKMRLKIWQGFMLLTVPIAVMKKKTLITTDFMRFGALLYAYSYPVIIAKISENAMRT